jgi:uncharacterized protein
MDDIQKVVIHLVEVSNPRRIILFGSYGRGEETTDEDSVDH